MYAQSGGYYYYTELYARAIPNESTGIYTVYLKQLLTCSIDSRFYQYPTSFNGSIDGVSVFAGTNKPWSDWMEKGSAGKVATTISEGSTTIDCSDGKEKIIQLASSWRFLGRAADYTPAYNATANASTEVTLAAIPRAAKITELKSSDGTLSGDITYTLTPSSNKMSNKHIVSFYRGEELVEIFETDLGVIPLPTEITVDLKEYKTQIYNAITDANFARVSIKLETYNGDDLVGEEKAEIDLQFKDEEVRPEIISAEIMPKYINNADFRGSYVKDKTSVEYSAEASAMYGAEIKEYIVTVDGTTEEVLVLSGERTVEIKAIDSRGIPSLPKVFKITVFEHRIPLIVSANCYRSESGQQSDKGYDCYVDIGMQYSEFPGNICKVNYRKREEGGDWGEYNEILSTSSDKRYSGTISGIFPLPSKAYHIQLQIIDGGNEATTKTIPIPSEWIDYQYNGNTRSWSFGEACPVGREKAFSLGSKAYFDIGAGLVLLGDMNGNSELPVTELEVSIDKFKSYNLYLIEETSIANGIILGVKSGDTISLVGYNEKITVGTDKISVDGENTSITTIFGLI